MLSSAPAETPAKRRSTPRNSDTRLRMHQPPALFDATCPEEWISDRINTITASTACGRTLAPVMQQDAEKVTAEFVNNVKNQLKDRPALFKRFITYISQARAKETSNDKMLAHAEKMLAAYPHSVAAFRRFLKDMQTIYFGHVGKNQHAQKVTTIDPARRAAWNALLDKVANHFAGQQQQYREFCELLLGYGSNVNAIEARCKPRFEGAPELFQELSQLLRKDVQWLHLLNPATSFARKVAQHLGSDSNRFLELITAISSGNSVGKEDSLTRVQGLLKDRPDLYNEYMNAINAPNFFFRQVPERPATVTSTDSVNVKNKPASSSTATAHANFQTKAPLSREQLLLLHEMYTAFLHDAHSKDPSSQAPISLGHKAAMRHFFELMQIEADLQFQFSNIKKQILAKHIQPHMKFPQPDPQHSPLSASLKLAGRSVKNDKLLPSKFPMFSSDIHDSPAKHGGMANRRALLQQFQSLVLQSFSQTNGPKVALDTQMNPVAEPMGKQHCLGTAATVSAPPKQPSILFTLPPSAWRSPATLLYASTRTFGSPIQPPTLKAQSLRVPLRELAGRGYFNLEMNLTALYETDGEVDSAMRWIRERQTAAFSAPQAASANATVEKTADNGLAAGPGKQSTEMASRLPIGSGGKLAVNSCLPNGGTGV